jgi:hypothetical protein
MNELWFPQGKWKRKLVSVSENGSGNLFLFRNQIPFHIPQESSTGKMKNGKWKRKPVSLSEPDIPESQSMRVCLWSIVVNSENSDPAKNKRADLPAAGKFTRGQKKKIPSVCKACLIDIHVSVPYPPSSIGSITPLRQYTSPPSTSELPRP